MEVVLFDPLSGGHHYAFAKLFARHLLSFDLKLILVLPSNDGTKIRRELIEEGFSAGRIRVHGHQLKMYRPKIINHFTRAIKTLRYWRQAQHLIHEVEQCHHIQVNWVFFAWLDSYINNYVPHQLIDALFHYQWSGLYFHPWYLFGEVNSKSTISSMDHLFKSKRCTGVALHDEFLLESLQRRIGKPVIHFPEIADGSKPTAKQHLAEEIRKRANGRTVIGLIGLARRKGMLHLVALCKSADPNQYFFFFAGPIDKSQYSPDELSAISTITDGNLEHCFYHPHFIEEGGDVNAVICALDILFLVYDNFRSSSNFSTKAAIFEKPVLAADQYWIGRVTREYQMGEVVTPGNTAQSVKKLEKLSNDIKAGKFAINAKGYLQVHREENLRDAFAQLNSELVVHRESSLIVSNEIE